MQIRHYDKYVERVQKIAVNLILNEKHSYIVALEILNILNYSGRIFINISEDKKKIEHKLKFSRKWSKLGLLGRGKKKESFIHILWIREGGSASVDIFFF